MNAKDIAAARRLIEQFEGRAAGRHNSSNPRQDEIFWPVDLFSEIIKSLPPKPTYRWVDMKRRLRRKRGIPKGKVRHGDGSIGQLLEKFGDPTKTPSE